MLSVSLDGEVVSYFSFIWVDQDIALMRGFTQGWPKQIGSLWITRAYDLPSKASPVMGPGGQFGATLAVKDRRFSAIDCSTFFEWFIGTMPLSDSSGRSCGYCGRSLHPPSCYWLAAGVSEVSRFLCMKLPGVSRVYDYAGLSRNLRYRSRPYCLPSMQKSQRPDCQFSEFNIQPACTPVYASPHTLRCATQKLGAERFATSFS
jgi:hypothetical protein